MKNRVDRLLRRHRMGGGPQLSDRSSLGRSAMSCCESQSDAIRRVQGDFGGDWFDPGQGSIVWKPAWLSHGGLAFEEAMCGVELPFSLDGIADAQRQHA